MSVTDGERREILVRLESVVGPAAAENIMQLLPHYPYDQLATRVDVAGLAGVLRGEIATLRADLQAELIELRGDLQREFDLHRELQSDVRTGLYGLWRLAAAIFAIDCLVSIVILIR